MVKDGVLDSSFALEEIPMRNLRIKFRCAFDSGGGKTAKMGKPKHFLIMIKDSKDGSVHGGAKTKVGELPKYSIEQGAIRSP